MIAIRLRFMPARGYRASLKSPRELTRRKTELKKPNRRRANQPVQAGTAPDHFLLL
jgi:hypothetical protein